MASICTKDAWMRKCLDLNGDRQYKAWVVEDYHDPFLESLLSNPSIDMLS